MIEVLDNEIFNPDFEKFGLVFVGLLLPDDLRAINQCLNQNYPIPKLIILQLVQKTILVFDSAVEYNQDNYYLLINSSNHIFDFADSVRSLPPNEKAKILVEIADYIYSNLGDCMNVSHDEYSTLFNILKILGSGSYNIVENGIDLQQFLTESPIESSI